MSDTETSDDGGAESPLDGASGEADPTQHEPDEYDPEADLSDPERDMVSVPEAPSTLPESEVPKELRRAFWKLVLVFNVALFSLSLGVMFIGFERRWTLGGALVAVGLVSFVRGYLRYQQVTDEEYGTPDDDADSE